MQHIARKVLLLSGLSRLIVASLAGALTALALAPFHFFIIGFFTFPVLIWLLDGAVDQVGHGWFKRNVPSFLIGWSFGFGYFVAGLWWISGALLVEAPEFAWAVPLAVFGLPAILALFYGFAALLARLLWSEGIPRILVFAAFMGKAEWLRSTILTGFPWNAIGQTIQPVPVMMQSTALFGPDTMNILAVLVFALPAVYGETRKSSIVSYMALATLMFAHIGYGVYRLEILPDPPDEGRIARIVQPAVDQSQKWESDQARAIFNNLLALSAAPPAKPEMEKPQIIIWPETSIPFILTREPGAVTAIADTLDIGQSLLAGVVREEIAEDAQSGKSRFYNSLILIDSDGIINGAADKVHLVPFGEYLPFAEQLSAWGLKAVAAADRGYSAAPQRRSLLLPGGLRAIPLICYEVIFASEVNRIHADDSIMINITNDAWYGDTPGPYQHLHQAQLRAVENGIPMIRGANNGISALIDAKGRITSHIDYGESGAVDVMIPGHFAEPVGKTHAKIVFWLIILFFATIGLISRSRR